MKRTAVLGAGSWGTALAWLLSRESAPVILWGRREEQLREMRETRRNPSYLRDAELPASVELTPDIQSAVSGAELIFVAVPSHAFRQACAGFAAMISPGAVVVSATKGIEEESLALMTEVIEEEIPGARAAVLSGPSFSQEVVRGHPTAVVAASTPLDASRLVQERIAGPAFRVYTLEDVIGVQVGGSYKNVVAIAAGAVEGLGYGTNTMAALVTRGLRELSRLALAMGGRERTLSGLSGLGDLVLTCTGALSRNKRVGLRLASGDSLEQILASSTEVAEGVRTARSINRLARRHGVETPIASMVEQVLYEGRDPRGAILELMTRESKGEFE